MIFDNPVGSLLTPNGTAWTNHNVRASIGSITSLSVNRAEIFNMGQIRLIYLDFTITTNGTGATVILATLREAPNAASFLSVSGREIAATGRQLAGYTGTGAATTLAIVNLDGTYPGASGYRLVVTGTYEV